MQSSKLSDRFKTINIKADLPKILKDSPVQQELRESLIEKVNSVPYWNEYDIEKQRDLVKSFVENNNSENANQVSEELLPYVVGLGPLQNLLDNDKVSAVFINDTKSVYIEIEGRVFNAEMKLSKSMVQYILNITGNRVENVYTCRYENYIIDVIKPEICSSGINITIRKLKNISLNELIENDYLPNDVFNFLKEQILNKKRIVISGGINSGKSVLLSALAINCIDNKRCYILENSVCNFERPDNFITFDMSKCEFEKILPVVLKSLPEYIIADLNKVDENFSISTVRSTSVENAFNTLVANYSYMSDKSAKMKVLENFDYIVYLDKFKVVSIAELKPARTMALSFRIIFER